jgi:hypothetical protein
MLGDVNNPPHRDRYWTASDRTGGPVDQVFDQLRQRVPGLIVERLQVTHPADDDNLWFLGDEHGRDRIQIETAPEGQPPFLIENGGRSQTSDTAEAVLLIDRWLKKSRSTTSGA